MSNLEIRGVSKHFGSVKALHDVSLVVNDGEFVVMLGPTGAGKTTTLRCVAGLEKLSGGEIYLDGAAMGTTSPAMRDVAMVFQNYALYPRKTVRQNMAFPLQARRLSAADMDRVIQEVARKLNIDALLDRRPAQLSGGQQQRVALGRAMVRQPRIFLMDEPLTNLDFTLRVEMRTELKRLQRELAATFFYVTNDQVEAMSMADRIAVLNKGVLQQYDTPETVYTQPANLFVAGFVGNPRMNFINCHTDAASGTIHGDGNTWSLAVDAPQRQKLSAMSGKEAVLGVRAEDIQITHQPRDGTFTGEVYVTEPLGDRLLVDVKFGGEVVKVKVEPTFEVHIGDPVWLSFDRYHLFNRQTGVTVF